MLNYRGRIGGVLAIIVILASACDVAPPLPPGLPTSTPLPNYTPRPIRSPLATAVINPAPSPMVGERVIRYVQEGGFVGRRDVLEIGPTGEVRVNNRIALLTTTVMLPDRLAELQASFTEIHFFELKNLYDDPSAMISDEWYDSVTFTLNGQTKTVTVARHSGANISPDDLDGVIHYLHRLLVGFGGLDP